MKRVLLSLIMLVFVFLPVQTHAHGEDGYIVRIKSSAPVLMSLDDELLPVTDNLYRADDIETIYSRIPEENIEAVFPDCRLELLDAAYPEITNDAEFSAQWYLDKTGAFYARQKGLTGKGVKIAVIDSGINAQHPDLCPDRILPGYNCILNTSDINDYSDNIGHGTMVSGVIAASMDNGIDIAGLASGAYIIPIKITDTKNLSLSSLLLGLKKAIDVCPDIINMSLGGAITNENAIEEMKALVDEAYEKGITIIAAAGNTGGSEIMYPAGFDSVIGVGSVGEELTVSDFSQKNNSVFITAPGENIISLSKNGATASGGGTSLSAPVVTAAAALIKEVYPAYTAEQVGQLLAQNCVDAGIQGYDTDYGHGILSIENITESLKDDIADFIVLSSGSSAEPKIYVHNNSHSSAVANAFFAEYEENRLVSLKAEKSISLPEGVTGLIRDKKFTHFMLWDSNMLPYAAKYILNKNS